MKIDFYISSLSGGGAEKVLVSIANKLAELDNQVTVVSLEKRPQFYFPNKRVNVKKISNKGKSSILKDYFSIKKHVKNSKSDVAISFLTRCNLLLLFVCLFSSQKVIVSDRNNPIKEHSKVIFQLQNLLYMRANRIIVQTEQIKKYYWKALRKKIDVIENPIDTEALKRQMGQTPKREKTILSLGRLEQQKDFKTLIRAFEKIHERYPDWIVKIFGIGDMLEELEAEVEKCGLKGKLLFCGRTDKPYLEMKKASIFVLSSFYEGFPNVLCEAMFAGDLCIASDCVSGPRELIEDGKNGWLFEIGNDRQLVGLIEQCITYEQDFENVRLEAERTVERLHLDKNIETWKQMIQSVVNQ